MAAQFAAAAAVLISCLIALATLARSNSEGDILYKQKAGMEGQKQCSPAPGFISPATMITLSSVYLDNISFLHGKYQSFLPKSCMLLWNLDLGNAGISGPLIPDLGGLKNLQYFELYDNSLSGTIPATLGNLTKLVSLDLYGNHLTGLIPATLGAIGTLRYLRLYENKLTGAIPTSLGNLMNLKELKLQKNALSGSIPSSLGNIKTLQFLKLNENMLSGRVPLEILSLIISGNLTEINIAKNHLAGTVRSSGFRVTMIIQDKLKAA